MIKCLRSINWPEKRNLLSRKAMLGVLFSLFFALQVNAQSRTVTGKILSGDDNQALPGANVLVKGTTGGTITGVDGTYSIVLNGSEDILVVSFVGYVTQEISVGSRSVIDVTLASDAKALEEVVVVGYGVVKKTDLTGSVAVIDTKEMTKISTNDVTQMMQGRVAGVAVNSDGQPGASPNIKIRGISTFGQGGASSEPLYVVDGLPLNGTNTNTPTDGFQPNANTSAIRDINPNDIESIQVLKDASAGAIYGVRAANGVVIITTKKGKLNQGLKVDLNMYAGVQDVAKTIPVLHRADYQMINRETFTNSGQTTSPPIPPGNLVGGPDYITNIDTDWQKSGLKQGTIQNYNVGLTGGGNSTSYFGSVDYFKNTGTLVGNGPDYSRYSVRLNVDTKKGKFRFGQKLYVSRSDETSGLRVAGLPGANPPFINDLVWAAPTIPIYDPAREGGYGGSSAIQNALSLNVIGINNLVQSSRQVSRALLGTYAEVDFLKNFTYKINAQYDYSQQNDNLFVPMYDLGFFYPNGSAFYDKTFTNRSSGLVENTVNYKKTISKHSFNALGGVTYQKFTSDRVEGRTTGLQKPYVPSLSNGTGTKSISEIIDNYTLFSVLGRLDYAYDDKYLLTANIRRDASSKFGPNNNSAVMPSFSAGWKIHKDITLPTFIRELKLRGGIGQVGNQGINSYLNTSPLDANVKYAFNGTTVFGAAGYAAVDPNIKWEIRTTKSIGIDAILANGIDFTFEYYSNQSDDILLGVPLTMTTGAFPAFVITNAGSMKNTGFEFSMNFNKTIGDFSFTVSPNFYTLKNEVLSFGSGNGEYQQVQDERSQVGRALGEQYGWVYEGIFKSADEVSKHAFQSGGTAPGDIKFKDLNGDGIINDADRTFIGSAIPNFYYGLNITAEYKGFDFTIFGSGSSGAVAQNNMYRGLMSSQSSGNTNYHEDILNRWTPTNTNTDIPRMIYLDPNNNARPSDRPGWLQSTAYFRLNTISLGYSLPFDLRDKLHLTKARLYVTVQNLATFTSYKGFNPDFQSLNTLSPGYDFGTYPRPVTWMGGIQVSF